MNITISAIQLTRRLVLLEGSPTDIQVDSTDFIPLLFHYEHGTILVYSEFKAPLGQVFRSVENRAKEMHLGNRLSIQDAEIAPRRMLFN